MRLLVISLEYRAGTFSGNGVYAQSQVRALRALGHDVLVISGKPQDYQNESPCSSTEPIIEVPLPHWGTLDRSSAWLEFAQGGSSDPIAAAVADFGPLAVLGVDWTSAPCYEALSAALALRGIKPLPFIYLNYRVYLRTACPADRDFIKEMENKAVEIGAESLVLSSADAQYISTHVEAAKGNMPKVLLPALRCDMAALPLPSDVMPAGGTCGAHGSSAFAQRRYLLCCVRLSPEKEPLRFVDLVTELASSGVLERLKVTPLLFGAAASEYAESVKEKFSSVAPTAVITQGFLGPAEMAAIYAQTLLNFHPPSYDAYGMTIVEAAAQGAPSISNGGGLVGATDLLSAEQGEIITLDFSKPISDLAQEVRRVLEDPEKLHTVACRAAAKARSWTELDNAKALAQIVDEVLLQQV